MDDFTKDELGTIRKNLDTKCNELIKNYNDHIEQKIKEIIIECDCKPSDIIIQVQLNSKHTISVKKYEYVMDYGFITGLTNE